MAASSIVPPHRRHRFVTFGAHFRKATLDSTSTYGTVYKAGPQSQCKLSHTQVLFGAAVGLDYKTHYRYPSARPDQLITES